MALVDLRFGLSNWWTSEWLPGAAPRHLGPVHPAANAPVPSAPLSASIVGSDKSQTLSGSNAADMIGARGGADLVSGRDGNDTILGGDGRDTLNGGDGNDLIYGHSTADAGNSAGVIRATVLTNIGFGAVSLVHAPGDDGFVYALNKNDGVISRIDATTGAKTTFLDIPDGQFIGDDEQGVLNVAFHPDYATNGTFFVYLTNTHGDNEIREYHHSSNPASSSAVTVQKIITIPHPGESNHNGGSMVFGPDGLLYVGTGDGGGGNDPNGNAQNKEQLLGKILRLDIDHDDFTSTAKNYAIPDDNPFAGSVPGLGEIWATGMRNPWRLSFDSATGDLYIGDVGQGAREEIDYIKAGTPGGLNFGWNHREGNIEGPGGAGGGPFTDPVFDYDRDVGQVITGGYVYHGPSAGLRGAYFYADFGSNRLFTLRVVDGVAVDAIQRTGQVVGADIGGISSFGTDAAGNLYAVTLGGDIIRLDPSAAAGDSADSLRGGNGNDTVYGGLGADTLKGDAGNDVLSGGKGKDWLDGGTGGDTANYAEKTSTVVVTLDGGHGATVSVGGAAEDSVRNVEHLVGGKVGDRLTGDGAANNLYGQGGHDVLVGGGGNDKLVGGAGADDLTGGAGHDRFVFNDAPNGSTQVDTVSDFHSGADRLVFDRAVFAQLTGFSGSPIASAQYYRSASGVAHDASDRLVYDSDSGRLYYDADGNHAGAAVQIATLSAVGGLFPTLLATDIFIL